MEFKEVFTYKGTACEKIRPTRVNLECFVDPGNYVRELDEDNNYYIREFIAQP